MLKAARAAAEGKVIAVVQPHRFTRLASLFDAFATCFNDADSVIVADVYPAGEAPIEGVDKKALATAIAAHGHRHALVLPSPDKLAGIVRSLAEPGDYVICLGAGSITQWAYALPGELAALDKHGDAAPMSFPDLVDEVKARAPRLRGRLRRQRADRRDHLVSRRRPGAGPVLARPTRTISPISWPRCRARRRSRRSASARTSSCATAASTASSSGSAAGRSARSRSWTVVASSPAPPRRINSSPRPRRRPASTALRSCAACPGRSAGRVVMNAGAHGGEIKDVLIEAHGLDRTGARRAFSRAEMGFSYRHSSAPEDVIFTAAVFQGRPGDPAAIEAEMERITRAREASQPIREKTGGSTFKNPPGLKAWELIDKAGCRGLRVGDAEVSTMHCNFLINRGQATAADLEALGEEVRRRVLETSGVALEWEIKRIGVALRS